MLPTTPPLSLPFTLPTYWVPFLSAYHLHYFPPTTPLLSLPCTYLLPTWIPSAYPLPYILQTTPPHRLPFTWPPVDHPSLRLPFTLSSAEHPSLQLTFPLLFQLVFITWLAHVHTDFIVWRYRPLEVDTKADIVAVSSKLPEQTCTILMCRYADLKGMWSSIRGRCMRSCGIALKQIYMALQHQLDITYTKLWETGQYWSVQNVVTKNSNSVYFYYN